MLDFYIISDTVPTPEWPEQVNLEHVGAMELHQFEQLKKLEVIDDKFDYFNDFRWNSEFISSMYKKLLAAYPELGNSKHRNGAIDKLYKIVSTAFTEDCGVIAYCD